jgi:hypothetical protein
MPILRLTKTDPQNSPSLSADMTLAFTGYDNIAYNFDWTGRNCLLPLDAVARAINPNNRQAMLRSIWIAPDAADAGLWVLGDAVSVLSQRLGVRSSTALSQSVKNLSVSSPNDRIAIAVGAKLATEIYSIEIMINSVDEGDFGFPELPVS